ncbi:MAG: ABC transporter permease [Eubacterium sp.]|nr:ABC transporter permease [Eubacterium sp.]
MKSAYAKNIIRTIRRSKGRYFAIMAIIMLGVGFFAGLRTTKPSMVETANRYFRSQNLYDFRILSTVGFQEEDIEKLSESDLILDAEGSYYEDFIYKTANGEDDVVTARTIGELINKPLLTSGRMPAAPDECIADRRLFGKDAVGKTIEISAANKKATLDAFKYDSYKIVGTCVSPLYSSFERGTTDIGDGSVTGFIYISEKGFKFDYYKEAYVTCQNDMDIYTDEYDDFIEDITPDVEDLASEIVEERYDNISAVDMMSSLFNSFILNGVLGTDTELLSEGPEAYVMDRNMNIGYQGYENDTNIVSDVAKVFPVFFFLIAALVCSTTMTRMIDDERGQIGTMRAIGLSDAQILFKYLIYSGSSALIGGVSGFFIGSWLFPFIIAKTYGMMYDFDRYSVYIFIPGLFVICMIVALLCSMGMAYLACMGELSEMPAVLIRPKAPAAGKRILLEYITPVWSRMKFLHKVTARNVFRFKKRMLMMIIGIAGCMALVMAGLGIRDSIANLAEFQYDEIEIYDLAVTGRTTVDDDMKEDMAKRLKKAGVTDYKMSELYRGTAKMNLSDSVKTIYVCASEAEQLEGQVEFTFEGKKVPYAGTGETIVSEKLCRMTGKDIGDTITITDNDDNDIELTIAGKFRNYVYYYVYVTPETYEKCWGKTYEPNSLYINIYDNAVMTEDDIDKIYDAGREMLNSKKVLSVSIVPEVKSRVVDMMHSLNAVVFLVIGSAALLAFIVLFNLSNINITERVREIATIKVLGFYSGETGAYVMRESLVLTIIGIIVGIPLGIVFNRFVISQIKVDVISFDPRIFPLSYVTGVILVLLFAVAVDLMMRPKLERIDMAESLKSAE